MPECWAGGRRAGNRTTAGAIEAMSYTILPGDNRISLPLCVEDNSIDAVVTDPPYGLSKEPNAAEVLRHWLAGDDYKATGGGFMGKSWDSFVPGPATWLEVYRALKPGGHALVFAGSRTQDLMSMSLRLAGFEIRDTAMWLYGSGFPKSLDISKAIDKAAGVEFDSKPASGVGFMGADGPGGYNPTKNQLYRTGDSTEAAKQWDGWGTALKPAYEPIIIARKPLDGTVADNVLAWGVGGLNIDGCRVPAECTTGWGGKGGGGDTWNDSNCGLGKNGEARPVDGRWPANVMHDGSDEVMAAFPNARGQQGAVTGNESSSKTDNTFGTYAARSPAAPRIDSSQSAARFFYCAKASKADRNEGLEHLPKWSAGEVTGGRAEGPDGLNSPRAGTGRTSGAHNHHPTVKPTELMRYLCRLVTPPGGLILDPFAGSGSTGKAAILEGFRVLLCEQDETYLPIIDARCRWAVSQNTPDTSR